MKVIKVLPCLLLFISLYCCEPLTRISDLPGDITGIVTDDETSDPIPQVHINLSPVNNSTITGDDGTYLLKNIKDGNYDIQASKSGYVPLEKDVTVDPANTATINFSMEGDAEHKFSVDYLDFGIDSTVMRFSISNTGKGSLNYYLIPSKGWIDIEPYDGQITTGIDTIMVTIDTAGMNGMIQKESINIYYNVGDDQVHEQLGIYVNGVMGPLEEQYYHLVRIGTQVWMAENLNAGVELIWSLNNLSRDDGRFEKYCYENNSGNCNKYGGMYSWEEAMDYNSEENDPEIMIQGICPDGWHIPDEQEWLILEDYAGGDFAGGNLKDTGTFENGTGLWLAPNEGATNKYGFTALPGGVVSWDTYDFWAENEYNSFWYTGEKSYFYMMNDEMALFQGSYPADFPNGAIYLRCIKDP